jgi:pyridoxine 5'-phosphate synthase PdxJ
MKIAVSLDPLFRMFRPEKSEGVILNAISLLQGAGVSSISLPVHTNLLETHGEDWFIICRKAIKTHCIVQMPMEDDLVKLALRMKPDMIIFGQTQGPEGLKFRPVDPQEDQSWLIETGMNLEANSISMGLFLEAQPKLMKHVQKINPDWIELSAFPLLESMDSNDLILKMEDYSNVSLMAAKLGIGITLQGDFALPDLHVPLEIQNLDEILLHDSFWELSMIYGIDKTLEMIRLQLSG